MDFNPDDFVLHSTHGVGLVTAVASAENSAESGFTAGDLANVTVMFAKSQSQTFTKYLLERSSQKLHPDGFHAYAFLSPEGAATKLKEEPVECIIMTLDDFPGLRAKTEELKDYLEPYLGDWKTWWEKTQELLKNDVRIDTTRAKYREYAVSFDSQSKAEKQYRAFVRNKTFESTGKVYELAKNTLDLADKGHDLTENHRDEVVEYIRAVVESEKQPITNRVDAIFRLRDGKWITESETGELIENLFKTQYKLYHLGEFALNRAVEYLKPKAVHPNYLEILATGMCARSETVQDLTEWAIKRGDHRIIHQFILTALAENLPPHLENYGYMAARLKGCARLAITISDSAPIWPQVIERLGAMLLLMSQEKTEKSGPIFAPIGSLAWQIYRRVVNTGKEMALFEALLQPGFPIEFLFLVLEGVQKTLGAVEFSKKLEQHLWEAGQNRGYDFINEVSSGDSLEAVEKLTDVAVRIKNSSLREKVGLRVCELVPLNARTAFPEFLPYLIQLSNLPGVWSWRTALNGIREEAYLETLKRGYSSRLIDHSLVAAITRYSDLNAQEIKEQKQAIETRSHEARQRVSQLEKILQEKEMLIKELRSGFGGDTAGARFEERVRIMRELVALVAEFERAVATHPEQSRGMTAMIKRLNNLLPAQKVVSMESIGDTVAFDSQKHQPADPVHLAQEDPVVVFERGFFIRDLKDNLILLKPALVRKPE
jgi:molecular chaperone GrpE (heat shock protein)